MTLSQKLLCKYRGGDGLTSVPNTVAVTDIAVLRQSEQWCIAASINFNWRLAIRAFKNIAVLPPCEYLRITATVKYTVQLVRCVR